MNQHYGELLVSGAQRDENYLRRVQRKWWKFGLYNIKRHVECLKEFLKSDNVKQVDLNKALCKAAVGGHDDCLNLLIKAGADVNVNPDVCESFTPLEGTARRGFDRCVKLLLEAGADVNTRGHIALKEAATHGKVECCDLLIKAGVDVNALGFQGYTPLMSAAVGIYGNVNHHCVNPFNT